jgi:glutathione S-transferase
MHEFHWPALITLGALVLLFSLAWNVGKARAKYKINAPATTGDPAFERVFRVQQNTLENTVIFLPALWLFAAFVNEMWASALGAVWIAARVWYAAAYQQEAGKRGPPFAVSTLIFFVLALGAAWGVVKGFLQ